MTSNRKLITFREPHLAILEAAAPSTVARAPGDYLGALLILHRNRWQEALAYLEEQGIARAGILALARAYVGRPLTLRQRASIHSLGFPPIIGEDEPATLAMCELIEEYSAGNAALKAELERSTP